MDTNTDDSTIPISHLELQYPFNQAIDDITRWREHIGDGAKSQAFFIELGDLEKLVEELKERPDQERAMGVRCYMARKPVGDDNEPQNHLLVVGVWGSAEIDGAGKKMYPNGKDLFHERERDSRIFDLTRPCPDMCDPKSKLYQAGERKQGLLLSELTDRKK